MSQDRDITHIRQAMFGRSETAGCFYASVKSVDEKKRTCVVADDNELDYEDVLLYAIENADLKGFVTIPAVDSRVLVSRIGSSNELYVAMLSEVDKVMLSIGDKVTAEITDAALNYTNDKVALEIKENTVKLSADSIEFNGGELGGLVKVQELSDNLAKVTARIDGIITAIQNGIAIPQDGGTGLQKSIVALLPTDKEDFSGIENDKVKH